MGFHTVPICRIEELCCKIVSANLRSRDPGGISHDNEDDKKAPEEVQNFTHTVSKFF